MGYEAQHTWSLESANRTPDSQISQIADRIGCVVVTKDADFLNSHILNGSPQKLLIVSTGNISNAKLLTIFEQQMQAMATALETSNLIELNQLGLVVHE